MKAFLLLCLSLFAASIVISKTAKEAGEDVCYEIIENYSQGSLHVLDCLTTVKTILANSPGISEMEMVEAVCLASKDFWFSASFAEPVQGQCLMDAKEQGMLPMSFVVPEFDD